MGRDFAWVAEDSDQFTPRRPGLTPSEPPQYFDTSSLVCLSLSLYIASPLLSMHSEHSLSLTLSFFVSKSWAGSEGVGAGKGET